jgi:hypothetical protein
MVALVQKLTKAPAKCLTHHKHMYNYEYIYLYLYIHIMKEWTKRFGLIRFSINFFLCLVLYPTTRFLIVVLAFNFNVLIPIPFVLCNEYCQLLLMFVFVLVVYVIFYSAFFRLFWIFCSISLVSFRYMNYTRISNPFSCSDFNLGSGGTLPMQHLVGCPAKRIWQVAHSPLTIVSNRINHMFNNIINLELYNKLHRCTDWQTCPMEGTIRWLVHYCCLAHERKATNLFPNIRYLWVTVTQICVSVKSVYSL